MHLAELSAARRERIPTVAREIPPTCRSGPVGSVIRGRGTPDRPGPTKESAMRYMLIIHNDPELHPTRAARSGTN